MELLQSMSEKLRLLRKFVGGLNTRQRIIAIIFALVFVFVSIVTEGLTCMLACGTALGVWAATRLRNRPAVYRWDKLIPLLPHLAKDRPLYAVEQSGYGQGVDRAVDDDAPTILQDEIAEYIRLMMRDFVMEWYRLLSDDDQFSHNVFIHFKALVKNGSVRMSSVNKTKRHFVCSLLHELRAHVDIYRRLQTSRSRLVKRSNHSIVSIYETFAILHPAVQNAESEKSYLSQMANCLILALLPPDVISCSTLVLLLQDFLMSNVLQPLVDLVSDPDFVNEVFILLLTDEPLLHRVDQDQPQNKSSSSDGKNDGKAACEDGHDVGDQNVFGALSVTDLCQIQQAEKSNMIDEIPSSEARGRGEGSDFDSSRADTDGKKLLESSEQNVPQAESKDHLPIVEGAKSLFQETQVKSEACINPSQEVKSPRMCVDNLGSDSEFTHLATVPMTMMEPSMPIVKADIIGIDAHTSSVGVKESLDVTSMQEQDLNVEAESNGKSAQQLRCHRRAASTGSNIFHLESTISGQASSSGSACGVAENIVDTDCSAMVTKTTKCEGMRSCFSADCLTQLDGGVSLTPSEENPSALVQSIPKSSIAGSYSSISDYEYVVPPKVQFLMEDTDMSLEESIGQQEVKSTPSGELSSDTAEDDGQATQTEASSSALSAKPLTLLRSKTEPALLNKPPHPKVAQSPGGEIPREWASWRIADLCIPTTSWMGDPSGKKPIVFFIINYTLLKKPIMSDDLDVTYTSTTKQEVRRRYREFVNLHARINNNPLLRRHLKGLKNVPKQSVLPLARPGAAAEEQKRVSLESYLMQLLDRRILHNSREIAEFLAIDGDAHIEFVRRPNQTPRIDKLLIRQVTGFVGQLKTALPPAVKPKVNAPPPAPLHAAPPQSRSAKHQRTAQSRDRRNSIAEKQTGLPALDQQPLGEDEWDMGVVDSSSDRLLGVDEIKESHIQKAMRLLVAEKHLELAQSAPLSPNLESEKTFLGPRSAGDGSDAPDALPREEGAATKEGGKPGAGNVALYQAVYGVLSEALLTQQSFILDKNMQKALQVGIGGLIDRWLENEIGLLFTEAQWGYYLSLLRELFWPGGVWRPKERESKSAEEMLQTKREALHELTHNAVSVGLSLLIGEEDLTKGVSLVLDSLQDAELNKHLVFTFLDHAMDQLVPEISEPKFQALLDAMP